MVVLRGCYGSVTEALWWRYCGVMVDVTVALRQRYSSVTVALRRRYGSVTVALRYRYGWRYGGITEASRRRYGGS